MATFEAPNAFPDPDQEEATGKPLETEYICGQLRGLEAACSIIIDLKQKMEHSDSE